MKKDEFEHIIRAAGEIADVEEIIVIGTQAIHAQFPNIEKKLKQLELSHNLDTADVTAVVGSMEVDLFIPNDTQKTNLVNGTIGEMSDFHDTFGYFADGVDITTTTLPKDWDKRLIKVCNANTKGITAYCLEIHDLMIAKLTAGREKDLNFFRAMIKAELINQETLLARWNMIEFKEISEMLRTILKDRIDQGFSRNSKSS